MTFAPVAGRHFWSTGYAWGTCELRETARGWRAKVEVVEGELRLERLELRGVGGKAPKTRTFKGGQVAKVTIAWG
jgi:hypothetical protein